MNIMTKTCPIMSYRDKYYNDVFCKEEECAFWDESKSQCCMKTQALATAAPVSHSFPLISTSPAMVPDGTGDWKLQK
jgi:hypothetical protein